MILLFLGSWRSTIIVCISIPLSILTSLAILNLLGETINVMTLGGLALAVGILVDDATVEIENIHRNLGLRQADPARDPGRRPADRHAGVRLHALHLHRLRAGHLPDRRRPLSVHAAGAGRGARHDGVVPPLAHAGPDHGAVTCCAREADRYHGESGEIEDSGHGILLPRSITASRRASTGMRDGYRAPAGLGARAPRAGGRRLLLICVGVRSRSLPFIGTDFFPQVDAGQIRLHVRAPAGTRIEETERYFAEVEDTIRQVIPAHELADILDNIGLPYSGVNLALSDTATIGPFDGEILVSLQPGEHALHLGLRPRAAPRLNQRLPDADLLLPARRHRGPDPELRPARADRRAGGRAARERQRELRARARRSSAAWRASRARWTCTCTRWWTCPSCAFDVDRTRAGQLGLTQRDVANSLLISLSSSAPDRAELLDQSAQQRGLSRGGADAAVPHRFHRRSCCARPCTPPARRGAAAADQPGAAASAAPRRRWSTTTTCSRSSTSTPTCRTATSAAWRATCDRVLDEFTPKLPQGQLHRDARPGGDHAQFVRRPGLGLVFAILLVYFLMVVNFQSWLDPFIILMALPGALSGIVLMLFVTQTTINVPSLMGAIMSIGVATANSILLVNFANDLRATGAGRRHAPRSKPASRACARC